MARLVKQQIMRGPQFYKQLWVLLLIFLALEELYLGMVSDRVIRRHQLRHESFKLLLFIRHVAHHIAQPSLSAHASRPLFCSNFGAN